MLRLFLAFLGLAVPLTSSGLDGPTGGFRTEVEPLLYRYPAIDPATFRRALDEVLSS